MSTDENKGELVPIDPAKFEMTQKGDLKLDDNGKPVFKDEIQWMTDGPQIMAMWTACKAALDHNIVPPFEIDAVMSLMENLAINHRNTNKPYRMRMQINYFVGLWHVLNSCRKFSIFEKDKQLDKAMDELAMWCAERIDQYHRVKEIESVEEKLSPDVVSSLSQGKVLEFKNQSSDKDQ